MGCSCETSSISKSPASGLENKGFARDCPRNSESHLSSLRKRAFARKFLQSRAKSPNRAFRARPRPKVKGQVSKMSVADETSSKSHASKSSKLPPRSQSSNLQTERFVHVVFKGEAGSLIRVNTSTSPAKQFHNPSPSIA